MGMRNSILVQGCKSQSLIEDCLKAYRSTDVTFPHLICKGESRLAPKLKKSVRPIMSHFLISRYENYVLQLFILLCVFLKF